VRFRLAKVDPINPDNIIHVAAGIGTAVFKFSVSKLFIS